jgi:hypothetical protein
MEHAHTKFLKDISINYVSMAKQWQNLFTGIFTKCSDNYGFDIAVRSPILMREKRGVEKNVLQFVNSIGEVMDMIDEHE